MRLTRGGEKVLPRAWGAVAERWAGRRAQAEGCSVWYKLRGSALEAWKPCRREGRGESSGNICHSDMFLTPMSYLQLIFTLSIMYILGNVIFVKKNHYG